MSKKIRFLSLALSATMVLTSLCACSAPADSNTSSKEDSSTSSEPADPNMDGDIKLNELGEFPLTDGDPIKLSVFAQYKEDRNSKLDAADNKVTAYVEELLNVDLDWNIVSAADRTAKLNLMFQSNTYEDIIFGTYWDGATQYTYGKQGYLVTLNDYVENDSYYYQKYIDAQISEGYNDQIHWDALTMPDGNIYSMAVGGGGSHQDYNFRMWIFKPWLDALKLDIPTTTDEFHDMLTAMKNGDPNGNGKADEVPLAGSTNGWNSDPFIFLANSFLYYTENGYYFAEDGEVKMAYMQDEFKDALNYYSDLVSEGLMMPDTFTQDATTLKTLATSPLDSRVVGATPAGFYGTFTNFSNREDGEWSDWVSIAPLEGPKGVRYAHQSSLFPLACFNITNNCDTPKAAFRFCDALYEEEIGSTLYLGLEGEGWRYVEEDETDIVGEKGGKPTFVEIDVDPSVTNFKWHGIVTGTFPTWEWGVTGDPELNNGVLLWRTANEHALYKPESSLVVPPLIFEEDDARDVVDISTTITSYLDEAIAKFAINGGVDEGWDAHIEYLKACGVEDLIALYQTAYDDRMEVFGK